MVTDTHALTQWFSPDQTACMTSAQSPGKAPEPGQGGGLRESVGHIVLHHPISFKFCCLGTTVAMLPKSLGE
eukprot:CAMPEP_0174377870 /NCGR_PEP_ID=MMETSP0811_2-20130205/121705_1 /TAXON_ID=73025 ORGANISM="Eutreptiella gymnastica-like, Strain CCMP1594" /NCGR_SAMPLE_ID=MMETSP0811_2 /ASSEMBLY_ACC=CAM_ASM_000667 /LENGTH=71 /DNA_ID=CAMNT_0015529963 /DNA_START=844 /DNA_END=1059 /DNA_ORIENTATION=+